jgi:hypothetical protein
LADIAKLLGQLQQPELGSDDFLFLGHPPAHCENQQRLSD